MDEISVLNQILNKKKDHLLEYELQIADFKDPLTIPLQIKNTIEMIQQDILDVGNRIEMVIERQYSEDDTANKIITIPIIVVAMTNKEANRLVNGGISDPIELEKFQNFVSILENHKDTFSEHHVCKNWLDAYAENRDDWKPQSIPYSKTTIKKTVEKIIHISNMKRHNNSNNLSLLKLDFLSMIFFSQENQEARRKLWRELRNTGCIIVIDPISLYHPQIRDKLLQSGLTANQNAAILILSPVNSTAIQAHEMLESEINNRLEIVFQRFDEDLERTCEFTGGNLRALQRWLHDVFLNAEQLIKKVPSENRQRLQREIGLDVNQIQEQGDWPFLGQH